MNRRVLLLLGLLTAFGPFAFDMYLPALPVMGAELRASEPMVQLTLSLCMVGLGLGQFIAGPLSDQVGRRGPLLLGIVGFTVGVAGSALAPTIELLLLARLVTGVGGGAGVVLARAMVRDLFSGAEAARAFAVTTMVFGLAPVIGPLIGVGVLHFTSWRGIFVALSVIGVLLLVAAVRLPETLPRSARHTGGATQTLGSFAELLRQREFVSAALVLGVAQTPLNLYLAMSSIVLQRHYGLSVAAYGWVFAVNALGIVLAGRLVMSLVGRHGSLRLLVAAVLVSVAAMAVMTVGVLAFDSRWTVLGCLVVLLFCVGVIMPSATTVALASQPAKIVGAASSLLGMISLTIAAAVPPLVSLLGVTAPIWAVAMLVGALTGLLPLAVLVRQRGS